MIIGWLCPFVNEPHIVVGAVVEGFDAVGNRPEFIPVVLPESTIAECIWRGPDWVVSMISEHFFAFVDRDDAQAFLFCSFEAAREHRLTVEAIELLIDAYGGEPRDLRDYCIVWGDDRPN